MPGLAAEVAFQFDGQIGKSGRSPLRLFPGQLQEPPAVLKRAIVVVATNARQMRRQ